ncbi:hypothetical protein V1264_014257 [Littorina saxatilis]|uniref:Uncharacterized protein n=1 Tax=Littorina saxatilis TaxID=31220 RepID=A0AAN9GIS6_9CAEN
MTAMPQRPPTRRPLTDQNDPPPPSLPPRPGGRGAPRPPLKTPVTAGDSDDGSNTDPEDYVEPANKNGASNDDQPEEVYDDFDEKPPPLPPHPPADPEGQEIYDDCNEEVQEIYDDLNEELPRPGPIVQHLPKKPVRNLPPPPPPELTKESRSVYEFDPDESGPQVPPSPPEGDSVYEVGDSEHHYHLRFRHRKTKRNQNPGCILSLKVLQPQSPSSLGAQGCSSTPTSCWVRRRTFARSAPRTSLVRRTTRLMNPRSTGIAHKLCLKLNENWREKLTGGQASVSNQCPNLVVLTHLAAKATIVLSPMVAELRTR